MCEEQCGEVSVDEAKAACEEKARAFAGSDPWRHRSSGMKCLTCMWFALKDKTGSLVRSEVGRCRRHAPTMNGYPVVFITDWCGDHKLNENAN